MLALSPNRRWSQSKNTALLQAHMKGHRDYTISMKYSFGTDQNICSVIAYPLHILVLTKSYFAMQLFVSIKLAFTPV